MTTPKETIQDIISKLDITEDANWTEDGAPALDIVQKLANDATITRDDINSADPGFVRHVGEAAAPAAGSPNKAAGPRVKPPRAAATPITEHKFTDEEMREILDRRVSEAEEKLMEAQKAASEATQEVARCQSRLSRAHSDHSRQFPPVTPAQAIKDHLASQHRLRQLAHGVNPDAVIQSPIDEVMSRKARPGTGQGRPTRPVMDGRLVLAKTA
jgi:hypothetical protein